MTSVPSSNVITVMLANYLTNNDPDKWLDMMNEKSKKLSMTNTKWFNASGAAAVAFKGYYSPQRYDNNQSNQTTARDLVIMTYNFIKKYPDILKYTSKPVVAVKEGTPYEETFETYNYSIPGADYGLKGVNGSKTGSSPEGAFNYIDTIKHGNQRMIAIIMGSGTGQIKLVKKSAIPLVMLWLRKCIKISLTRKSLAKVNKRSLVKNIMSKMMSTPQSKKAKNQKSLQKMTKSSLITA